MPSPDELAATMLQNLPEKTGKSLKAWHKILGATDWHKHGELVRFLKQEHGVTHGFANMIVAKFLQADMQSSDELITSQYAGSKAAMLPIYRSLVIAIRTFGKDVEIAPKKTYVSLRRKKQFALVQPSTKTRVDVGLNLKNATETSRLEKSGSFNAMVSHRVRVSTIKDVDKQLIEWLREAYKNAG